METQEFVSRASDGESALELWRQRTRSISWCEYCGPYRNSKCKVLIPLTTGEDLR